MAEPQVEAPIPSSRPYPEGCSGKMIRMSHHTSFGGRHGSHDRRAEPSHSRADQSDQHPIPGTGKLRPPHAHNHDQSSQ